MVYEHLIQAISRTNRVLPDKPFGNVIFYRQPNTMNYNLQEALKMYGDVNIDSILTMGFEDRLEEINKTFKEVEEIFFWYNKDGFSSMPKVEVDDLKFPEFLEDMNNAYKKINKIVTDVRSVKIMGFDWQRAKKENDVCNKIKYTEADFHKLTARHEDIKNYLRSIKNQENSSPVNVKK